MSELTPEEREALRSALIDGRGLEAIVARIVAERTRAAVERAREEFRPVAMYLDELDAFYGDEQPDDEIDTASGSPDDTALCLSDLRRVRDALSAAESRGDVEVGTGTSDASEGARGAVEGAERGSDG